MQIHGGIIRQEAQTQAQEPKRSKYLSEVRVNISCLNVTELSDHKETHDDRKVGTKTLQNYPQLRFNHSTLWFVAAAFAK